MVAVLLALAASVSWGLSDFGAGYQSRRLPVPLVLAVSQLAGLVLTGILVAALAGSPPSWTRLAWGAFAGVVGVAGLLAFYRGFAVGAMGVVAPIAATAVLVPVAFGLTRGERPSALQAAGVGLALAGVVAASLEPERRAVAERRVAAGAGFAMLAAIGFGWSLVGLGEASKGGPLWATFSMRVVAVPLVLAGLIVSRTRVRGREAAWPILVTIGLCDTGANLLFGFASTRGLLSVVSVLSSLYPVIVVVLARVVLAERLARPQLAGAVAALVGVALISAGG